MRDGWSSVDLVGFFSGRTSISAEYNKSPCSNKSTEAAAWCLWCTLAVEDTHYREKLLDVRLSW